MTLAHFSLGSVFSSIDQAQRVLACKAQLGEWTNMSTSGHAEENSGGASGRELQRNLTNRHIQLIAIGGAIGTGLFMGSGKTIATAGPSILLVYLIIGSALFLFMRAMGELLLSDQSYGTFADIVRDFLGPTMGFVVGWTYWLCWVVTGIADVVAITGYVHFWWPDLPSWIPVIATALLLFALNAMTVKAFGETEFWFAMIKIVAIVALIVVGVIMVAIGMQDNAGTTAAVSNLWVHGGIFPTGFMGFLGGFQIAIFAFVGIELVGTTVAETANPEKTLPKAINSIPVRVVIFYICALAVIMMVTPWNQIDKSQSPFVTMFSMTGLGMAASLVNLVVLTSAASSANSGIYSTSRMLFSLSIQGDAAPFFGRLSKRHIPQNALFLSCVFLLSGAVLLAFGDSILSVFTVVTATSATLFMVVWILVVISYLVYVRKYPERHKATIFPLPGGVFSAWFFIVFIAVMTVVLSLETESLQGLLMSAAWMVIITVVGVVRRHRALDRRGRASLSA